MVAQSLAVSGDQEGSDAAALAVWERSQVEVVLRLEDPCLARQCGIGGLRSSLAMSAAEQQAYVADLKQKQDRVIAGIRGIGGRELSRLTKALNAVIVRVDERRLARVSSLPHVISVRPVVNMEMNLRETVPHVGAAPARLRGRTGQGIRVAVLDSGVDYTHAHLGGPGTLEAYEMAYGTSSSDFRNARRDGLFPTGRVVDGWDFVGERWPSGPLEPDADPIDFQGHGTHVADILAGREGVAPAAQLLAVKVCSAVATACSGVALLQGMEFALDPNGDDDLSDAVDVINLSLGSAYGQREDDLNQACVNAVALGVTVVCSAGNDGDRPYIMGSPGSVPDVITVGETQVPTAATLPLQVTQPSSIAGLYRNTATVDWAPLGDGFSGELVYVGAGCSGAGDYSPETVAGKVVLVDRGICNTSIKVDRAARAGALAVIIALTGDEDAASVTFGGGTQFVPALIVTQSVAAALKSALLAGEVVDVTLSFDHVISLAQSLVGSSSRGPGYSDQALKPDLCAPGAMISAVVGTGIGTAAFGGTSGSVPMVSGAAAILLEANRQWTPAEVKAALMNSAEGAVFLNPATQPGLVAPVTRIGSGELRVDRALHTDFAAWDAQTLQPSLSFGYQSLSSGRKSLARTVQLVNNSTSARSFEITPILRRPLYSSGALTIEAPRQVTVAPNSRRVFSLKLILNSTNLPPWRLNGGELGGDGTLMQEVEFDGAIRIRDASGEIRVPWHVLVHRSADVQLDTSEVALELGRSALRLVNRATVLDGRVEAFAWLSHSEPLAPEVFPRPGDNFAIVDLKSVGARLLRDPDHGDVLQFAIHTYGARAHPNYPAEFRIFIDADQDGEADYTVYNAEAGSFGATGQNATYVRDEGTGLEGDYFFTDADLNSANVIMSVPLSALGVTADRQLSFLVAAYDNYFTGDLTDVTEFVSFTPASPQVEVRGIPESGVPAGGFSDLTVDAVAGGDSASPSQMGVLFFFRDSKPGQEAATVKVR